MNLEEYKRIKGYKTHYQAKINKNEDDFITVRRVGVNSKGVVRDFINLTEDGFIFHIKLKRSLKNG